MQVIPYDSTDALELVQMWRSSFEHGVDNKDEHPLESQLKFFLDSVVPQNTVRVGKEEGVIVAFLATTLKSVSHLYVRVQNIGQGIGAQLLNLAKSESVGSLWRYTFAKNQDARRFYEKHGLKEIERESQNMYKLEAVKYNWHRGASEA